VIEQILHVLLQQTLTLALAACAVRLLQAGVVRRLGAAAAYLCWLLVPVAMLAVALPRAAIAPMTIHVDVAAMTPGWIASSPVVRTQLGLSSAIAMAAWAAGAIGFAALLVQRQRRFESFVMSRPADTTRVLPAGSGPAVLGLWRRRIVLPQDFDIAFDAEERRLMLLHEGVHLRRADNVWNLLAAALLVLHWFNPLAWWAWRRLRADQELSCDAAVLRHEAPGALAVYAGALLKAQGVALTPPLATSWQSSHPLVERVRMLQLHRISSARHRAGLRVAALSILLAGSGGYALQAGASAADAATGASVMTAIEIRIDAGSTHAFRLLTRSGEQAVLRYDTDGVDKGRPLPFELDYTVTRLSGDRLQIDATLRQGAPLATLASPRLITHEGEAARVEARTADGSRDVAVSFVPTLLGAQSTVPTGAADATKTIARETPRRAL
jgi:beta-lactamase regulating signal transducer with metallopeptidase domain